MRDVFQAYDTIENMELVNNLEKVKFTAELSFFPQYIPSDAVQQKVSVRSLSFKNLHCISLYRVSSNAFFDFSNL